MAKTYRPYVPEQDLLLPPSLRDWLPEDHLAFFVSDLIDQLDLSAITTVYEDEERGYPPYHPVMLTKVLVYAYCVGVFSSRKIQRRLVEDVAFRVLAAGNRTGLSDDRRFSQDAPDRLARLLRAGAAPGARAGRAAGRPRGARREQDQSERVEAQGDELRTDARETTAAAGGSEAVARPGGGGGRGRGRGVRAPIDAATSCRRNCNGARVG